MFLCALACSWDIFFLFCYLNIYRSHLFPATFDRVKKFGTWRDAAHLLEGILNIIFFWKLTCDIAAKKGNFFEIISDFHFLRWIGEALEEEVKSKKKIKNLKF